MPSKQYRVDRLAQEIQKDVDEILLKRVRDPRVQNVTITGVDVTGDLQQATIYYSILSDLASDAEQAQFCDMLKRVQFCDRAVNRPGIMLYLETVKAGCEK